MGAEPRRECVRCGRWQPESEYYRTFRQARGKTYVDRRCKTCTRAYLRERYQQKHGVGPRFPNGRRRGKGDTTNRDAYGSGLERHLHGSPGYILMHEMCEAVEQAMMRAGIKRFPGRDQSADEQPDLHRSYRNNAEESQEWTGAGEFGR